jgi:hypothetical protein
MDRTSKWTRYSKTLSFKTNMVMMVNDCINLVSELREPLDDDLADAIMAWTEGRGKRPAGL